MPADFSALLDDLAARIADRVADRIIARLPKPATEAKPMAVSRAEAGKLLGISEATIKRLIRDGELRAVKCGERVVVPMAAIEEFLQLEPTPA